LTHILNQISADQQKYLKTVFKKPDMTDILKTLKNVRDTIQKLTECRDYVINKQKKAEMDRLITELRLLEDSLLVKNPLTSIKLTSSFAPDLKPSMPDLNQFRVYAEQRNLTSFPEIKQAALQQGLNPNDAVASVMQMQQARTRAEIEALSANLLPDIRGRLYGRNFSVDEVQKEVKRIVQSNNVVPTHLVDAVTEMITRQLLRESGIRQ